jgi:hypothetical protein
MTKDSEQAAGPPNEKDIGALRAKVQGAVKLGHLGTLNQCVKALSKVIRAMADGSVDSQVGARICNGLGIMRACLETATLERLEERLSEMEHGRPNGHGIEADNRPARWPH